MSGTTWQLPVILAGAAVAIVLGLFNLGVITIAGGGRSIVRYRSDDVTQAQETMAWGFDDVAEGALPDGSEVLSESRFGGWSVRAEPGAPSTPNALCQSGVGEFPAIALTDLVLDDLVVTTRFKPISGRLDQAAGLIFRVQDGSNYYILRASTLEDNVNFYLYRGGRRSMLRGADTRVQSGAWQELRVEVQGNPVPRLSEWPTGR
jgi:hypothetical protein